MNNTTHTLRLIDEYLTQGGYAPNIDPETLESETPLIAAAPHMLWTLEQVDAYLSPMEGEEDVYAEIRGVIHDAIAKATSQ